MQSVSYSEGLKLLSELIHIQGLQFWNDKKIDIISESALSIQRKADILRLFQMNENSLGGLITATATHLADNPLDTDPVTIILPNDVAKQTTTITKNLDKINLNAQAIVEQLKTGNVFQIKNPTICKKIDLWLCDSEIKKAEDFFKNMSQYHAPITPIQAMKVIGQLTHGQFYLIDKGQGSKADKPTCLLNDQTIATLPKPMASGQKHLWLQKTIQQNSYEIIANPYDAAVLAQSFPIFKDGNEAIVLSCARLKVDTDRANKLAYLARYIKVKPEEGLSITAPFTDTYGGRDLYKKYGRLM